MPTSITGTIAGCSARSLRWLFLAAGAERLQAKTERTEIDELRAKAPSSSATGQAHEYDRYCVDGSTCVVDFDLADDGSTAAIVDISAIVDIFTLNDQGEIARLAVYRR